jgi:hypothetical protein
MRGSLCNALLQRLLFYLLRGSDRRIIAVRNGSVATATARLAARTAFPTLQLPVRQNSADDKRCNREQGARFRDLLLLETTDFRALKHHSVARPGILESAKSSDTGHTDRQRRVTLRQDSPLRLSHSRADTGKRHRRRIAVEIHTHVAPDERWRYIERYITLTCEARQQSCKNYLLHHVLFGISGGHRISRGARNPGTLL